MLEICRKVIQDVESGTIDRKFLDQTLAHLEANRSEPGTACHELLQGLRELLPPAYKTDDGAA